jgi:GT2 family glycosyltransferase
MNAPVTVLVRNYNGKDLLRKLLPGVVEVAAIRGNVDEVLVVDDGSLDGSVEYIETHFPTVRVEKIIPNSGNSIVPVNVGMKLARNPVVMCLDNDVLVKDDFLTPLVYHFQREDVFAVCPKIINPLHDDTVESVNYPFFRRGRLVGIVPGRLKDTHLPEAPTSVWYAPGNGAAYSRSKYMALGGLDDLYRPIYNEDVDICHRAWKRGWKTIYEPAGTTYHLKHVTTKKHLRRQAHYEVFRNKNAILFTWKNLHDRRMLQQHLGWVFLHLLKSLATGERSYPLGVWSALKQAGEVLRKREKEITEARVPDKKIFDLLYGLHHNPHCEAAL